MITLLILLGALEVMLLATIVVEAWARHRGWRGFEDDQLRYRDHRGRR